MPKALVFNPEYIIGNNLIIEKEIMEVNNEV